MKHQLFGSRACGSALAEIFLSAADIPYEVTVLNWEKRSGWKKIFGKYNPQLQVPTLVLPNKQVLTESLAIAVYAQERGAKLIPQGKHSIAFWRWAIFIVANIYPTFTYRDNVAKFVKGRTVQKEMAANVFKKRKALWKQMEAEVKGPWFLGATYSAIDIYVAVMVNWTPRRDWFQKNCPKLFKIAKKVEARKMEGEILKQHFDVG